MRTSTAFPMASCASSPGFRRIYLQATGARSSGGSSHDSPAWAATCRITFRRTTGRISGLCRTVTAWTSCSTAPWTSASAIPRARARYVKPSPVLFEDLAHLFECAVAYSLPNGSCTLVDRETNDLRNGLDRLHRLHLHLHLHLHLNGESGDGFRSWLSELARHLASMPGVRKLRLHLPEPYVNARHAPPSPHVDHQVSDERKDIGVIEIGFANTLTAREFCESEAYRATIQEQRRHLRSVGAFLVTGIYTHVRDGITTAGLQCRAGSRLHLRTASAVSWSRRSSYGLSSRLLP
jgi:hypothetical protein